MSRRRSTTDGQHRFAEIPRADISRSAFNRSSGLKTTFDSGYLVPILLDEILPGDTINFKANSFIRLGTQIHPILDNAFVDTFYFFIPLRLIWDNFPKFMGEQRDPGDSTEFEIPMMDSPDPGGYVNSTIYDYMGIPPEVPALKHSSLFLRAYNEVYNQWFRDENMIDSVSSHRGDSADDPADYVLLRRGKRHDFYTSALPWPQKGDAVTINLGASAPVTMDSQNINVHSTGFPVWDVDGDTASLTGSGLTGVAPAQWDDDMVSVVDPAWWGTPALALQLNGATGIADLSAATASTINELRTAFQVQKLLERDARGGTRLTEVYRSHFGVTSPDMRLNRPEFLGGSTNIINVTPVPDTAGISADQGDLASYATSSGPSGSWTQSFTEHGIILGLVSARADLNYQQGLFKMWTRLTRFDFFWPALQHLGESAILNKEIYAQGSDDAVADEAVFGYQERWAEYRYKNSMITGQFRSTYSASLDAWHLAQEFDNLPTLGQDFIEENPPFERVIAAQDEPEFLADFFFQMRHIRPMPTFSTPGLIDHF